ncbi:MAG: HAMP domain-containing histidine kinase [Planctomycetaceae bacterium]|nr:HAMP domain-containing histidine kinase [Planctomycetaceae bacterium]
MKRNSIILIVLILVVPLAALGWAMVRIAENEHVVVRQRFRQLLEDRLQDVNGSIAVYFESVERDLATTTNIDRYAVDELRQIHRKQPRLLQLFILSPRGQLIYPDPMESSGPLNGNERMFLIEAAKMFTGQDLKEAVIRTEQTSADAPLGKTRSNSRNQGTISPGQNTSRTLPQEAVADQWAVSAKDIMNSAYQQMPVQTLEQFKESKGWFVWYWDRGVNLIYWQRRPSGDIVGGALERARWMADLIAQLPDTMPDRGAEDRTLETRIRLVSESGETVYQWGSYEPQTGETAFCEIPVAAPLSPWRLQCFVAQQQLTLGTGGSTFLSLWAVLIAVALTLFVCGFLFVREYKRDMRLAAQQVSFVNQVSHELKTPLTNIRLYAELLDQDLDHLESAETEKPRRRLSVILSEGQRLSRLIGNVLTFAQQQRRTLQVQPQLQSPGIVVEQIVDRFRPAMADQNIDVRLQCSQNDPVWFDADCLEQILGNLISNVEKYAAAGGLLDISTSVVGESITIDVKDAGPGIDPSRRTAVFEPFARLSNSVSYAAGTGIGLSIARELAQLHGGDLRLMNHDGGCWFQATIKQFASGRRASDPSSDERQEEVE